MATLTRNGHVVINGRVSIKGKEASDPELSGYGDRLTRPGRAYHYMTRGRPVGHDTTRRWTMPDDSLTPREEEALAAWEVGLDVFGPLYRNTLESLTLLRQDEGLGQGRDIEADACDITAAVNRVLGSPHA